MNDLFLKRTAAGEILMMDETLFTPGEVCEIVGGGMIHESSGDCIKSVSIDTRTITPGSLFVPLKGEHCDGHEFIEEAFAGGASAALVSHTWKPGAERDFTGKALIRVPDPLSALQTLAFQWRNRFRGRVVAVTGSNGKTTTKDWIAMLAGGDSSVYATPGNLNNHIGLPLSLFGLRTHHRIAILELGVNHPGEMGLLGGLVRPHIAVVTNIGPAHLEGFGSVEKVAEEKGRLLEFLEEDFTAVLNGDDDHCRAMEGGPRMRTIFFGVERPAEVCASRVGKTGEGITFELEISGQRIDRVTVEGPGRFNLYNFLAAAAAAQAAGIPVEKILERSGRLSRPPDRWQCFQIKQSVVINDAYNANPGSMKAALEAFGDVACRGRKHFVCGTMLELGEQAPAAHREVGIAAAESGVDLLFAVGDFASEVLQGFLDAAPGRRAEAFRTREEAALQLRREILPGDAVLLKGSRVSAMERMIPLLRKENGERRKQRSVAERKVNSAI